VEKYRNLRATEGESIFNLFQSSWTTSNIILNLLIAVSIW